MAKLVKWIDKKGNIQISEYANNDDPIKESNVIEISNTTPVWTTDKAIYKVTYDYDDYPVNPVTEFYSTNDVIVAIARDAQYRYNVGNYTYEDLAHDYGYDPDYDNVSMKLIRKLNKTGYCNFISVYDHSAHSYFLGYSRGWDTSCIGLIYVPYETCADGELFARNLLDEVTNWANGDCYQVMIEQLVNGDWDTINGCCGYYTKEHCVTTTKNELEGITKNDTDPLIITIDNTY